MGDKATIAKARQELEDLYLGIPDASVDLTFKDMTSFQQGDIEEKNITTMEPILEDTKKDLKMVIKNLAKSPSLDFSKALEATKPDNQRTAENELYREHLARNSVKRSGNGLRPLTVDSSQVYNNTSVISTVSPSGEKGGRKRPGIPHSNICALCSEYIYIFRHRCLVCGRVYCRNCVGMGMGEMTEGRKCVDCLGRKFSQRYIKRAGHTGCFWRYPSTVKQQELIWAEKGPRKSNERRYGQSSIESRSRCPVGMPGTPTRSHVTPGTPNRFSTSSPTSFVASGTFSPNPHNFPF